MIALQGGKINKIFNKVGRIQCHRTLTSALVSWTKPVTHCENFGFKHVLKYTDSNKRGSQMTVIQKSISEYKIKVSNWNSVVHLLVTSICIGCHGVGPGMTATCSPSKFTAENVSIHSL